MVVTNEKMEVLMKLNQMAVEFELAGATKLANDVRKLIDYKISQLDNEEYLLYCKQ